MRNAGLSKSAENRWETADDVADEELGKTNKIYTVKTDLLKTKLRTPPSQIPQPYRIFLRRRSGARASERNRAWLTSAPTNFMNIMLPFYA